MIPMSAKHIHLQIITPREIKVDEKVDMVIMRCTTGDMGFLPGHEARSAVLGNGILRVMSGDSERWMAVFGGLAEIKNDVLTILTTVAEWPEDIDRARAEEDREHYERRLQMAADDIDIQNDHVSLRRSLVRIEVSAYSTLSKPEVKEKE